jgi:hypothetical protein
MNNVQCGDCGNKFFYFSFSVMKFELTNIVIKDVNDWGQLGFWYNEGDPTIFRVIIRDRLDEGGKY